MTPIIARAPAQAGWPVVCAPDRIGMRRVAISLVTPYGIFRMDKKRGDCDINRYEGTTAVTLALSLVGGKNAVRYNLGIEVTGVPYRCTIAGSRTRV